MIYFLTKILILLVVVDVILAWMLPVYSPIRRFFDSMVEPMLFPIRKAIPIIGRIDISPMILIIIIHIIGNLLGSALKF